MQQCKGGWKYMQLEMLNSRVQRCFYLHVVGFSCEVGTFSWWKMELLTHLVLACAETKENSCTVGGFFQKSAGCMKGLNQTECMWAITGMDYSWVPFLNFAKPWVFGKDRCPTHIEPNVGLEWTRKGCMLTSHEGSLSIYPWVQFMHMNFKSGWHSCFYAHEYFGGL